MRYIHVWTLLALWLYLVTPPAPVQAADDSVLSRVFQASALLVSGDYSGTAFVVAGNEHMSCLLTAEHFVKDAGKKAPYALRFQDATICAARVLAEDPRDDLALISCTAAPRPRVEIATEDPPLGEPVVLVGCAQGFKMCARWGHVATVEREHVDDFEALILDIPASNGDSGGAVVDNAGRCIGVLSRQLNGTTITLVAPAAAVRRFLRSALP